MGKINTSEARDREIEILRVRKSISTEAVKNICALLNSGGGTCTIQHNEINSLYSSSPEVLFKENWSIFDLILYVLKAKLWATTITGDDILDIDHIINEVCDSFTSYRTTSFEMAVIVPPHTLDNTYFCVKKSIRKSVTTNEENKKGTVDFNFYLDFDYYFKIREKTIKTDKTHIRYYVKLLKHPDLPLIKDYEPSDGILRKKLKYSKESNKIVFQVVGDLPHGNFFYKYMDLESALRCLELRKKGNFVEKKPNIRFVEPTSWDDQYEGRFYNARYKLAEQSGAYLDVSFLDNPFLYACCFSSKRENEAAWILYSHNKTGLASRCVEFTLNRMRLREELVNNLKECAIYIGAVQYINKEEIDNIPKPKIGSDNHRNENYYKYFAPFTIECYLNLLLLKRPAFEHEKEVRIFIVPNDEKGNPKTRRGADGTFPDDVKPKSTFVDIDWVNVIDEVKIDENCTEYEVSLLENRLNVLAFEKKKRDKLKKIEYENLLAKLKPKPFNPYKDESLSKGPITVVTNQQ